jgi:hypothetical protein
MIKLEESTFLTYAANHYENTFCHSIKEFEDDLKRFQHIRKLLIKYSQTGVLKERLILNHLIVVYNCFGTKATDMLFMKLEGFHEQLCPFLEYLNRLPKVVTYSGKRFDPFLIIVDQEVVERLKEI